MVPALLDPPAAVRAPSRADSASSDPRPASLLELPEVRALVVPLSVSSYKTLTDLGVLPKRTELIRGFVLEKMSKSPLHYTLNERLCAAFRQGLPSGYVVRPEGPLRLADSEPEPDLAVVRGELDDFLEHHPTTAELVVEVAVSSVALDRVNAALYAEAGVPEYWIVLGTEKAVEVYRQPQDGVYRQKRLYTLAETLVCESVPGLQAALADWFV